MDIAIIALLVLGLFVVAGLAIVFAPGRNAALGAWSLSWTGKRRRSRDEVATKN